MFIFGQCQEDHLILCLFDAEDERKLTPGMLKLKVDGIFTNNPAYTKKVLKEYI